MSQKCHIGFDQIGQAQDQAFTIKRRQSAPGWLIERTMSSLHSGVDIRGIACPDSTDLMTTGGVEHSNAGGGRLPLPINKVTVCALEKYTSCRAQA
ncbi:hypothetical protein D3C85_1410730 [compost metagenome]